jgi:hypothetical protein
MEARLDGRIFVGFHLDVELLSKAYKHCEKESIVTAEQRGSLAKAVEDDPIVEEIRVYRNMSHEFLASSSRSMMMLPMLLLLTFSRPWTRRPLNNVLRSSKWRYKRRCRNGN